MRSKERLAESSGTGYFNWSDAGADPADEDIAGLIRVPVRTLRYGFSKAEKPDAGALLVFHGLREILAEFCLTRFHVVSSG